MRSGRGVYHPPTSSAEVKETVATAILPFCSFMAGYSMKYAITSHGIVIDIAYLATIGK
jgi:hypothetical protein